jgi:hypothetical protein
MFHQPKKTRYYEHNGPSDIPSRCMSALRLRPTDSCSSRNWCRRFAFFFNLAFRFFGCSSHFDSSGAPAAWITKSGLLELFLGFMLLIAVGGSATAYFTPKNWVPDLTSWLGLVALFGVMGLMVYSEKAVLVQQNSLLSDPVVDALGLSSVAMVLTWQLYRWTQS